MLLFQKVEELAHKNTDAKRSIGEFLLAEKDKVDQYSMQEIADLTYTSKASLVRFAKSLGYTGWKEFMQDFLSEIHYEKVHYVNIDPNFPFSEDDSIESIKRKLSNLMIESIIDTEDQLDDETLRKAAEVIEKANQVALFGTSPNTYLGSLFRRKMLTIGKNILIPESDTAHLCNTLREGDCAILISYSGNNEYHNPINLIPILKEHHVTIIALTGLGENTLRENADIVLNISTRERLYTKIATFTTEQSIQYILNVLFGCYFVGNFDNNLQAKINSSKRFEKRYSIYSSISEDNNKEGQ
ncbi:MAG: MurR/RpiR family transcriptional regulator [Erysipelotrichaceae bacterium]|nr:MurR/RpiR family transcriptional regulator [Erysipelotrichaceae bacterium]